MGWKDGRPCLPWCGLNTSDDAFDVMRDKVHGGYIFWGEGARGEIALCHPTTEHEQVHAREIELMEVMMMFAVRGAELPNQELVLRRTLNEHAIRESARAEVEARPREPQPEYLDAPWGGPGVGARATEAQQVWREQAAALARNREADVLAVSRMPNWETDEPPPLTDEQAAILAKHQAESAWAAWGALEEILGAG